MIQRLFFLSILSIFAFCSDCFSQEEDPIKRLAVDKVETSNFEIVVQRGDKDSRPTAREVGVLVEKLCEKLDKIFLKYSPQRVASERAAELSAEQTEGEKTAPVRKDKNESATKKGRSAKKDDEIEPDPNRVIPKCRIFIFSDRETYTAKCVFDGLDENDRILTDGYGGFYMSKTNSIYMNRSWSVQITREIVLHEATHYYMHHFLPGGNNCYPQWFHEGLAKFYESHTWVGGKLIIGTPLRIEKFDSPASALLSLKRFQAYLQAEAIKTGGATSEPDEEKDDDKKKNTNRRVGRNMKSAKTETPIDPVLIQTFLDNEFTREKLVHHGVTLKNEHQHINHRYAMYLALGRFLLDARPDFLEAIIRQISLWEAEKDKTYKKWTWFDEAWKKVAAETKPITVEEVGRWLTKNQLPFRWTFGDWQDLGDQIAGKGEEGHISVLAFRDPNILPKFAVFPKTLTKFQTGVVINYIDNDNFGVVLVNQDGDIVQMQRINGSWVGAKNIGKANPVPNKNNPYGNGVSFVFAVGRQGGTLAVQVNGNTVGAWPKHPKGSCGFFLSSTEALFVY